MELHSLCITSTAIRSAGNTESFMRLSYRALRIPNRQKREYDLTKLRYDWRERWMMIKFSSGVKQSELIHCHFV